MHAIVAPGRPGVSGVYGRRLDSSEPDGRVQAANLQIGTLSLAWEMCVFHEECLIGEDSELNLSDAAEAAAPAKVGDLVFKRFHDEVIITRTPAIAGRTPTPGQAAHRERFKPAVLYRSAVIADPEKKAIYQATAKGKGISVFALTIGDFLNAPAVDEIDLSGYTGKAGETIRVELHYDNQPAGRAERVD